MLQKCLPLISWHLTRISNQGFNIVFPNAFPFSLELFALHILFVGLNYRAFSSQGALRFNLRIYVFQNRAQMFLWRHHMVLLRFQKPLYCVLFFFGRWQIASVLLWGCFSAFFFFFFFNSSGICSLLSAKFLTPGFGYHHLYIPSSFQN